MKNQLLTLTLIVFCLFRTYGQCISVNDFSAIEGNYCAGHSALLNLSLSSEPDNFPASLYISDSKGATYTITISSAQSEIQLTDSDPSNFNIVEFKIDSIYGSNGCKTISSQNLATRFQHKGFHKYPI